MKSPPGSHDVSLHNLFDLDVVDSPTSGTDDKLVRAELGYFDLHLDRCHVEGEIETIGRDLYYRNVILFVQRIQDLIAFESIELVKENFMTLLHWVSFEWYTSEFDESNCDDLRKTPVIEK